MFIVLWIGLSIVAGVVASSKGRSGIGIFFLSLFLSPLFGRSFGSFPPINREECGRKAAFQRGIQEMSLLCRNNQGGGCPL